MALKKSKFKIKNFMAAFQIHLTNFAALYQKIFTLEEEIKIMEANNLIIITQIKDNRWKQDKFSIK